MTTVKHKVHFRSGKRSKKELKPGSQKVQPIAKVPRIAKLMALAIRLDQLIQSGQVKDQAELARLGHVSRARLTQIMNLLCLAPDIQEELLFAVGMPSCMANATERQLRLVIKKRIWTEQRAIWRNLDEEMPQQSLSLTQKDRGQGVVAVTP